MQIINRLIDERYDMKKNISLLTFSVQNVNSSYWEPHSSFNANSESFKVDQDNFTWMMIFSFLITCLLDNVLALWWEIRSWSLSGDKGDFQQTKKDDFNTLYLVKSKLSWKRLTDKLDWQLRDFYVTLSNSEIKIDVYFIGDTNMASPYKALSTNLREAFLE